MPKPNWMDEEKGRAANLHKAGKTANDTAPQLARVTRAPKRMQKALYIQNVHSQAFEQLVFDQKRVMGKKAPELAEEALELLFQKYQVEL